MLDQPAASHRARLRDRPRLDFQDHLADLEASGLLVRIDRPINKDTELHPLVRWQFLGGVPEDKRRAFLFTNVIETGDDLRKPGGGLARLPVPVSTPGFDSAPYLTATLCITRDPDSGIQNM